MQDCIKANILIEIILENNFFQVETKNEIKKMKDLGYKIYKFEIDRDIVNCNDNTFGPTLNNYRRISNLQLILYWDCDTKTYINLTNEKLETFNLSQSILQKLKTKEEKEY